MWCWSWFPEAGVTASAQFAACSLHHCCTAPSPVLHRQTMLIDDYWYCEQIYSVQLLPLCFIKVVLKVYETQRARQETLLLRYLVLLLKLGEKVPVREFIIKHNLWKISLWKPGYIKLKRWISGDSTVLENSVKSWHGPCICRSAALHAGLFAVWQQIVYCSELHSFRSYTPGG